MSKGPADKFDGVIRIDLGDPEDDLNYIENYIQGLPPESRRFAYKLLWRSTKQSWELMGYALDKIIKNLQKTRHPKWPKTEKTLLEWELIYKAMQRLDNEWADTTNNKTIKPKWWNYAECLAKLDPPLYGYNGELYGDRILREIKKWGDEGQNN
jgi:hypothetical protein